MLACMIIGITSCSPSVKVLRYNQSAYSPTSRVDVLRTKPPDKPYDEIAELEVKSNYDDAIQMLVSKAKEIGTDAIILMGERGKNAVAVPIGDFVYVKSLTKLWSVAIRYK